MHITATPHRSISHVAIFRTQNTSRNIDIYNSSTNIKNTLELRLVEVEVMIDFTIRCAALLAQGLGITCQRHCFGEPQAEKEQLRRAEELLLIPSSCVGQDVGKHVFSKWPCIAKCSYPSRIQETCYNLLGTIFNYVFDFGPPGPIYA